MALKENGKSCIPGLLEMRCTRLRLKIANFFKNLLVNLLHKLPLLLIKSRNFFIKKKNQRILIYLEIFFIKI